MPTLIGSEKIRPENKKTFYLQERPWRGTILLGKKPSFIQVRELSDTLFLLTVEVSVTAYYHKQIQPATQE